MVFLEHNFCDWAHFWAFSQILLERGWLFESPLNHSNPFKIILPSLGVMCLPTYDNYSRGVNEPMQAWALLKHARKIGCSKMAWLETTRKILARTHSSHKNFGSLTTQWLLMIYCTIKHCSSMLEKLAARKCSKMLENFGSLTSLNYV